MFEFSYIYWKVQQSCWHFQSGQPENRNCMRSYETRKAVLLETYLASDIKVPILSFIRIDYDVYDLACIQLFFSVMVM